MGRPAYSTRTERCMSKYERGLEEIFREIPLRIRVTPVAPNACGGPWIGRPRPRAQLRMCCGGRLAGAVGSDGAVGAVRSPPLAEASGAGATFPCMLELGPSTAWFRSACDRGGGTSFEERIGGELEEPGGTTIRGGGASRSEATFAPRSRPSRAGPTPTLSSPP